MAHATSLKRFSAVSVAVVLTCGTLKAEAQDTDLTRVNQDELASFYGRMNVVVGSGARAFGMGGAFLARADDATAASWNPAGLSYLRRAEFSLVGAHNDFSQLIPRVNDSITAAHPVPTQVTTRDQLQGTVADFVGVAFPLRFRERTGAIQVSYQRSFSFTGSRKNDGPVGVKGFNSDGTTVPPIEFTVVGHGGFDTLSLSSGFEVHSGLRLGISVNRWVNGFGQVVVRPDRQISSDWYITGTNFNFGVLLTPTPKLNLGAVVKTPFSLDVQLYKTRTDTIVQPADPELGTPQTTTTLGSWWREPAQIRMPGVYGLGASFRLTNTVTLSADFTRTAWSKATITDFFSLAQVPIPVDHYGPLPFPAVEEGANGQADTNQLRVGAEWVLRLGQSGNVLLPLRAGFFRDEQPVVIRLKDGNDAPLPEEQPVFSGLTAGIGVTIGGLLLDIAFIREGGDVAASRENNGVADAIRTIRYNRVFASLMLRFGPRR